MTLKSPPAFFKYLHKKSKFGPDAFDALRNLGVVDTHSCPEGLTSVETELRHVDLALANVLASETQEAPRDRNIHPSGFARDRRESPRLRQDEDLPQHAELRNLEFSIEPAIRSCGHKLSSQVVVESYPFEVINLYLKTWKDFLWYGEAEWVT